MSGGLKRKQLKGLERRICVVDYSKVRCSPAETASFAYLRKHAGFCGRSCIEHDAAARKIRISERACAACQNCAKRCPDNAVRLVKLPTGLDRGLSHSFGEGAFRLSGLPTPRVGSVLGILGSNGCGKSTALNVLTGNLMPNLGQVAKPPEWKDVVKYYRGSGLQNHLRKVSEGKVTAAFKPQLDNTFAQELGNVTVEAALAAVDVRGVGERLLIELGLAPVKDRHVEVLSGGELQRLAIAITLSQEVDIYVFDEPSSFLDLAQRLQLSRLLQDLLDDRKHECCVIVVEHDLTVLSAVSDHVACVYGEPGAYGVVTPGSATRVGINNFLAGYLPQQNMRIRPEPILFWPKSVATSPAVAVPAVAGKGGPDGAEGKVDLPRSQAYPAMQKVYSKKPSEGALDSPREAHVRDGEARGVGSADEAPSTAEPMGAAATEASSIDDPMVAAAPAPESESKSTAGCFMLDVEPGVFQVMGEVVVLLGENGTGKSTFLELLGAWLLHGHTGATPVKGSLRTSRNTGEGAQNKTEAEGTVSVKRQHPLVKARRLWKGTVKEFLEASPAASSVHDHMFRQLVLKPLRVGELLHLSLKTLSGGELQRLAVVVCMGTPANVYLLDEPSAALDCEQRVAVARVVRKWVVGHLGKTAFVVEHDFAMASILADRVIVFSGERGVKCTASPPLPVEVGFNKILKQLGITMHLDPKNGRPRVNKREGQRDRQAKKEGRYFQFEAKDDDAFEKK